MDLPGQRVITMHFVQQANLVPALCASHLKIIITAHGLNLCSELHRK